MDNFKLLGTVEAKFDIPPELWAQETWRQEAEGSAHGDTETIFLRMCRPRTAWAVFNDLQAFLTEYSPRFADACASVLAHTIIDFPKSNVVEIGRIMLVKLRAGGQIQPHIDQGKYADYYDRMHYVIGGECDFTCGDETVHMRQGEAWWFNHRLMHSVVNNDAEDRVHLIIDYRRAA